MEILGFGKKEIKWIKELYELKKISVLVNGSPSKEVSPKRGLRQGDPLPSLLFNLVGYVFSSMLKKAEDSGIFIGVKLRDNLQITPNKLLMIQSSL